MGTGGYTGNRHATYVTKTGEFGTLGHGITDVDTGTLLNLHGGELFQTQIVDIMKGEKGNPGELQGYINMIAKNTIGKIKKNTEQGVFGEMKQERVSAYSGKAYEVGRKQEIEAGKAYLYANLEGRARMYEIEIEDIKINARDNKSMEIRVTDKKAFKTDRRDCTGDEWFADYTKTIKLLGLLLMFLLMTRQEVMAFLLRRCWCSKRTAFAVKNRN